MSMSTTRNLRNRSSRYSSPATFAEIQAPPKLVHVQKSSHGSQTNLDEWVEPTIRSAVPSFEDTKGLERVGVLEHMAPLGVAPTQKLLQKLKVNLNRASPRVTPFNAEEVTPPTEPLKVDVASPVDTEPLPESTQLEDPIIISSPPRGRPGKKEVEEMRQVIDLATPSPVKLTFAAAQSSPRPQSIQGFIRQDRMKNVIDRAIIEANNQSDSKLVPGLQQLWEDAKSKPQLWTVLDAILNRTPTNAQFRVFKRYIKRGVRLYQRHSSIQNGLQSFDNIDSPQSQPIDFSNTFPSHDSPNQNTTNFHNYNAVEPPNQLKPTSHQDSPIHQDPISPSIRMTTSRAEIEHYSSPRRKRSGSESSISSLSSAKSMPEAFSPETVEVDADADGQITEGRPVRSTGQRQATNRVAAGSRTRSTVIPPPESSQQATGPATSIKFISKKQKIPGKKEDSPFDLEVIEAQRRDFENGSFYNYNNILRPESDERTIIQGRYTAENLSTTRVPPPVIHPYSLLPSTDALFSPTEPQARPELPFPNGASRKRPYDEVDKEDLDNITPLSSSPAPFFLPPAPGMINIARGATPRGARLPPPPNKARKSARVMVSPNKPKNGGITAGISRAGPGRDLAIGNGMDSGAEDNDEFCTSCGGEGILLCCDGCTNSFHHGCLEPPLNPDDDVEGEWFCPRCIARRNKETLPVTGLLGQLIRRASHTIPKAYALPFEIRDYFEGVKSGEEGEYEEIGLPRTQTNAAKMNRAGFFEEPNYKELKDSKGNWIICHRCQKTADGRDIIPCDYCPAKWHMDCVDPPLAVPPRRRGGDKPTGYWKCPLHVDGDLAELGRQAYAAPGDLGRVPRLRKPKKAIPIDVDLMRGFRNNGVIEVELMKDEMPDIREVILDSGVYRLPEKGIRLDFIDRVKKSWFEDQVFPRQFKAQPRIRNRLYRPDDPVLHHPAAYTVVKHKEPEFLKGITAISVAETARTNAQLRNKSFKEQSAVMSLVNLANQPSNGVSVDPLADLTNALIAEAPTEVETAINSSEKDMLIKLQELISGRLAVLEGQPKKIIKSIKRAASEPGLLNGDISEQLNGDADNYGDDEGDGGSEAEIVT